MNPTAIPITLWKCAKCGIEYRDEDSAKRCGVCDTCGREINCRGYCTPCASKREREKYEKQFEKAELIEYKENFVFCPFGTGHRDGYFESMDDLLEHLWDNYEEDNDTFWPKFVFATDPIGVQRYDLSDVLEHASGDMYEDFDAGVMKGQEELQDALNAFYEKNTDLVSYQPDYKKKIRVPTYEEMKADHEKSCMERASKSLSEPCPCGMEHGIATVAPEFVDGKVVHPNLNQFGMLICENHYIPKDVRDLKQFIDEGCKSPQQQVRDLLEFPIDTPLIQKAPDSPAAEPLIDTPLIPEEPEDESFNPADHTEGAI